MRRNTWPMSGKRAGRAGGAWTRTPPSVRPATRWPCGPPAAPSPPWRWLWTAGLTGPWRSCGRPATTPCPRGRWGSACSTTWRWPPGTRSRSTAWSASWWWTGTSTTATGPRRSSMKTPACFSFQSTAGMATRAPATPTGWGGGREPGSTSTCPCPTARATPGVRPPSGKSWCRPPATTVPSW